MKAALKKLFMVDLVKERVPSDISHHMDQELNGHTGAVLPDIFLFVPNRFAGTMKLFELLTLEHLPFRWREGLGPIDRHQFIVSVTG